MPSTDENVQSPEYWAGYYGKACRALGTQVAVDYLTGRIDYLTQCHTDLNDKVIKLEQKQEKPNG